MSQVTIRKQGCQSCKKTIKDENDILVKNIYTGLLLFLGVLSAIAWVVLVVYSAVLVIYRQQFLIEFLKTLIFTAPFLVMRKRGSRVSMFAVCAALLLVSVMLVGRQAWLAGFAGAVGTVFGVLGVWHSVGPRYLARQHISGVNDDELAVRIRFDQDGMTISGSWGTSFYP